MKNLFFINDTLENKISYFLLSCFLIALPFQHFFSEIFLTCFAIHTLIHFRKNQLQLLKIKIVWIISSIFFLSLITVAYSNYPSEGFKEVDHQLAIVLFPLCLSLTNLNLEKYKISLLKIFAFTCTITIVYLYFHAFRVIHYYHYSWSTIFSKAFLNQNFSLPIELHATYLSMYVALSMSILLFLFFLKPEFKNGKYILFTLILFAGLIQLSSRSVVIATCVIILIALPALLLHGKKRWQFSIASLLGLFFLFIAITNINALKKRYISDLKDDLTKNAVTPDLTETRMKRWGLELQLISRSPIVGHGGGSEKYVLKKKYFEKKFYRSYLVELNAHNQYFSFLVKAGIIGLLIYLYVLYFSFSKALKRKDFLFLSFLILISVVSISENILDVNKGIFFYSFFLSLFLITGFKEKINIEKGLG
jgi:O-antigen ligase